MMIYEYKQVVGLHCKTATLRICTFQCILDRYLYTHGLDFLSTQEKKGFHGTLLL